MNKLQKSQTSTIGTIRLAIDDAMDAAEVAVNKAIRVGQLLLEAKPAVGHGNFQEFIAENFPRLTYQTAARWMQAAERTFAAIDLGDLDVPKSRLLGASPEELSESGREAQQMVFDFTRNKTIKDCLAEVITGGDTPHRITRAANGMKHGGTRGEDRKDFPKFIGEKLSDVSAHLKTWKTFTPAQADATFAKFDSAVAKWPTQILTHLKQRISEEIKTR